MSDAAQPPGRSMEADLTAWGKAISLETIGRRSGRPRMVTIGFVEEPAGSMLVAGSDEGTHWTLNLRAEPLCHVTLGGRRRRFRAEPLAGPERERSVAALILKYGTPAESLGSGPAFRLRPDGPLDG